MAARSKRSTKPSARISRQPLEFFVDRSLGRKQLPAVLREAGLTVHIHDDHFANDTPDVTWIEETARRGWIVIAADEAIARRSVEIDAIRKQGARILVPGLRKRTAAERARLVVAEIERIAAFIEREPAPWVARISPASELGVRSARITKLRAFR